MQLTNKDYFLGEDLIIQIVPKSDKKDPLWQGGFGVLLLGPEERNKGVPECEDHAYSHPIKEELVFHDLGNLHLFQMGCELIERALEDESYLEEESKKEEP